MSSKFFQNKSCEHFPCHKTEDKENFNCLLCFCPLYYLPDCGGSYTVTEKGVKDCTECLIPHYNYNYCMDKIVEYNKEHPLIKKL